ncbi:hypothetical protein C8R43DRAFT_905769, partial [Mycena crocata]
MNKYTSRFRLARVPGNPTPPASITPSAFSVSREPEEHFFEFRVHADPTPPKPATGSFEYDLASGDYLEQWENWSEFQKWQAEEERKNCIEICLVNTYSRLPAYERKCRFVCSRSGTGGIKEYVKKHPTWQYKLPSKRTDCKCSLTVKQYPGIPTVLGAYSKSHNHALGNTNLPFTRIPKETREYMAGLLRLKVKTDHILQLVHNGVYSGDDAFDTDFEPGHVAARSEFIQLKDIQRIEKDLGAESIRLHPDDGQSTTLWVEKLRAKDYILAFKSRTDPSPPGSQLASDIFFLAIQTPWQRRMFAEYGEALLCIDGTHNLT